MCGRRLDLSDDGRPAHVFAFRDVGGARPPTSYGVLKISMEAEKGMRHGKYL